MTARDLIAELLKLTNLDKEVGFEFGGVDYTVDSVIEDCHDSRWSYHELELGQLNL